MAEPAANWMDMEGSGQKTNGGLIVQFERRTKRDTFNSTLRGEPIDVAYDAVVVGQPGEKDNVIHEVNNLHKLRWPNEWRAYLEGREQIGTGRPMDVLFPGNPEIVSTLKARHIYTIEQLAEIPDSSASHAFVFQWKQIAQKFLAGAQGNRFPQMEADLVASQQRAKMLEEQLAALSQQVAALAAKAGPVEQLEPMVEEAPIRRGPGRPRTIREGEAA